MAWVIKNLTDNRVTIREDQTGASIQIMKEDIIASRPRSDLGQYFFLTAGSSERIKIDYAIGLQIAQRFEID